MKQVAKRMAVTGLLTLCMAAAWALPSVQDVQAQVKAGHYAEAEQSMAEVVSAKPGSAKAHYLYAEILAHNGRFEQASQQAKLARQADPKIGFTDPAKFRDFERLLEQELHPASAGRIASPGQVIRAPATSPVSQAATTPDLAQSAAPSGWQVPGWAWLVGAAALAWVAWRVVARTFAASPRGLQPAGMPYGANAPVGTGYGPGYGTNYGPGYGPGYGAPTAGSSALRTGMAVAGGVAAGMAIDQLLHRGRDGASSSSVGESHPASSGLAQGMQPGFFDDDNARLAADELERRDIDFGNDGGWDGGGDSGGDVGGGSSSSDDW